MQTALFQPQRKHFQSYVSQLLNCDTRHYPLSHKYCSITMHLRSPLLSASTLQLHIYSDPTKVQYFLCDFTKYYGVLQSKDDFFPVLCGPPSPRLCLLYSVDAEAVEETKVSTWLFTETQTVVLTYFSLLLLSFCGAAVDSEGRRGPELWRFLQVQK